MLVFRAVNMENSKPKPSLSVKDFVKGPADDQPRPQSFRDKLKDLAESSSLHGIPKIVSSRQVAVKVLWCLLFLATSSVVTYQLVNLFRTYYSYPIQTSVSLAFSAIPYPAISICNMNPVRASKLDKTKLLKDLISKLPDDNARRKRREAWRNPLRYQQTYDIEDIAEQIRETEIPFIREVRTYENYFAETDDSKNEFPGWFNYEDTLSALTSDKESEQDISGEHIIRPSNVKVEDVDQQFKEDTSWMEGFRRHKRAASSVSPSIDPSSTVQPSSTAFAGSSSSSSSYFSSSSSDYWYDWYNSWLNSYYYNDNNYNYGGGSNLGWDQIYKLSSSKKDVWEQRVEDVKSVFRNTSLGLRGEIGHQKEDLFVSITFAGQTQEVARLRNFSSVDYGNCYTLSGPRFIAWRSGLANGFKFTLNLEVDEYIKNFTTGYGLRVVFHEPGTQPLPAQDGITLSPGTETSIGLKTVRITRLGEPHGNCDEGEDFEKQYQIKYSLAACYEFCRIKATVDVCSCLLPDAPDGMSFNTTFVPICNSSSSSESHKCVFDLNIKFNDGHYDCKCREPCSEFVYSSTMSSRYWPTDEYLEILLAEICDKENVSASWTDVCDKYRNKNLDYFDLERERNNFVRALIYFEDLNYERITEEPLYEGVRFLSDIGGTLGLFLGASVLSIVEVLQVIMEIILHLIHKFCNKGKTRVTSLNT
ncbi:hypothetical protein ACF0H5_000385 [Mactra antiquata]